MGIDGMIQDRVGGVVFYRWAIFEPWKDRLTAVLSTRLGGVSQTHLESMNLGHAVGDKPENLIENRRRIAEALNLRERTWSVGLQVHGCRIAEAVMDNDSPYPDTDGLEVTDSRTLAAVMLADCHPILIYDPQRHRGVVCHSGWRGTAAGIAGMAVRRLQAGGSRPEHLIAAIGPGIGPCCYAVGPDVHREFHGLFPEDAGLFSEPDREGRRRLDLEAANSALLIKAGIPEDRIGRGGVCTACRIEEFFSYRKEKGLTGRQAALMALL